MTIAHPSGNRTGLIAFVLSLGLLLGTLPLAAQQTDQAGGDTEGQQSAGQASQGQEQDQYAAPEGYQSPNAGKSLSEATVRDEGRGGGETEGGITDSPITFGRVAQILVFLLILVGMGVAVVHYARKGTLPIKALQQEGGLRIAETKMLGNRQFLAVVEYDQQKLLLGVGPDRIQHLCFLETAFDDDLAERADDYDEEGEPPR